VVAARDGIRPLCDVEVVKNMVARTDDGGLVGGNSPMVTTVVGIEEFPEGVTTFVSIVATLFGTHKDELIRWWVPKYQWWRFQIDQKISLQGLKWLIPQDVGWALFLVTWLLQKTLVGLASALVVAGVAPM
jgi:hypothetical protein